MPNSPFIYGANGATSLVSGGVNLPGLTSGTLQLQPAAVTTSYMITMPGSQGGVSTTLSNDGFGNLSWVAGLPSVGTDGQLLKSMNSTYIQSRYYNPYVNYVGNAFAEVNTNGWATYSDAAQNIPVDGTGGTATGLTFSRSTSSPLRDSAMFQLVQTNSTNVQGKGVSFDFTIDTADQAKALSIQFDYNASSTFVASNGITPPLNDGTTSTNAGNSDVEVFVYDVTNSILIYVSPEVIVSNGSNNFTFKGIFQTASNSTSYRLIFHCATTNANATGWTLKWTNVFVGPQYITQGPSMTDWVPYTPTFTGFGTVTSIEFVSRRVGDTLQVLGKFTTGTTTGVEARITLGYNGSNSNVVSADTNKIASIKQVGFDVQSATSTSQLCVLIEPSVGYFTFGRQDGSAGGLTKQTGSGSFGNTTTFSFFASTPIQGWSSNTLMSNDANIRVCSALAYVSSNFAAGTATPINYDTVVYDTHGAITTSPTAFRFTAPVSGYYQFVTTGVGTGSTSTGYLRIYKNGTFYISIAEAATWNANGVFGGSVISLNAGDTADIRPSTSLTASGGVLGADSTFTLSIHQVQGPSQIAVIDSVNARYFASATSISGSLATVVWTTKDYDSSSAMSSGLYTIPISGKYQINAALLINATFTAANSNVLEIQKNSTVVTRSTVNAGGIQGSVKLLAADQLSCVAGDVIRVQVSSAGTGPTIASSNFDNYFSIFRTGN